MTTNKILLVGDVHATADDLVDCQRLIDEIVYLGNGTIDAVVFMGDQTHNHAVMNMHVMDFWQKAFDKLSLSYSKIYALVGNHDLPGNTGSNEINAMSFFNKTINVVDDYMLIGDKCCAVAYQHSNAKFAEIVNKVYENENIKTFLVHQTFDGAKYENGFFAKDGVSLDSFPKDVRFFSGHIHSRSTVGPVRYIGSPRWRTMSDIDQEKSLSIINVNEYGQFEEWFHYLDNVQRRIMSKTINLVEGFNIEEYAKFFSSPKMYDKNKDVVHISVHGVKALLDKHLESIEKITKREAGGYSIKVVQTDIKEFTNLLIKESDGISAAFNKYVEASVLTLKDKELLKKLVQERILNG